MPPAGGREADIATSLLQWWQEHQRSFPWRKWQDPYRLLVAEILLRQTRAEAVASFLPGFLAMYPSARALAGSDEEILARVLQPLGLYRQRARQLRSLAAALLNRAPSQLTVAELQALPGIGPYSAGVVAAATGVPAAAVDTNVARVVGRVLGFAPSHAEARKSTNVWAAAERLVTAGGGTAMVTWAVLDLAAGICTLRQPRCTECPVRSACAAASGGGP
jgi:A/G-specific adenine glycosylase